jgi:carboxyl-terminal processing protease
MAPACIVAGLAFAGGCGPEPPAPRPLVTSLAQREAASPPRTADCRSFDGIDLGALPAVPPSPSTASFELVWRTVLEKHVDPTLGCLDWPAIRLDYGARVAAAPDATTAYTVMNEMLGLLGQSHLQVTAPARRAGDGRTARGPAVVPLRVRLIGGEPVVVEATVDGIDSGVPLGARVLEIDGVVVDEVLAPVLGGDDRPTERAMRASQRIELTVRVEPLDAAHPIAIEVPCKVPGGERVSLGYLRDLRVHAEHRMIDEDVGYLAFNTWMLPLVERVREGVARLRGQGMRALVLDLRGNPGGVGAMVIPVARELLPAGGSLGKLRLRNFTQTFEVAANAAAFEGPLVVLVDEGTASTSELFAIGMRDLDRISVVGASPSAGMALPSLLETLPDGGLFQYVVGDYESPRGSVAEGEGVVPDVLVEETRARIAAGEDPVLAAGVSHARTLLEDPAPAPGSEPPP